MKKGGVLVTILLILSLLSLGVSAQNLPCDPQSPECPEGETCQYYGDGYYCGTRSVSDFNIFDMLLGFDVAENLLKNKLLSILHIVKENVFQTELKIIETSLAQHDCNDQPASFSISKQDYRYGKLDEIDALIKKLFLVINTDPEKFGRTTGDMSVADGLIRTAEGFVDAGGPATAFHCKYWAYQALIGKNVNPSDSSCECPVECLEPPLLEDQEVCDCPTCGCDQSTVGLGETCNLNQD